MSAMYSGRGPTGLIGSMTYRHWQRCRRRTVATSSGRIQVLMCLDVRQHRLTHNYSGLGMSELEIRPGSFRMMVKYVNCLQMSTVPVPVSFD